jgi:beta-lactamase superfamily II metal-dependent hydrolase
MEIIIFDVEHGGCAAIFAPSGKLLMIDCDNNDTTGWRPSNWVAANGLKVANLTVTNFDEDHVGDLPALRRYVETFTVNWTVPVWWVRAMKAEDGLGPGVEEIIDMMETNANPTVTGGVSIDYGPGFLMRRFYQPLGAFTDENGLSVVTFIQYEGVRVVFPGDLTKQAWERFMQDPAFVFWLYSTRIFVASHHGREDGYYPEMFSGLWQPDLVVISDKRIVHESQMINYGQHAKGVSWDDGTVRRCLTTRRHGHIRITPTHNLGYRVTTDR